MLLNISPDVLDDKLLKQQYREACRYRARVEYFNEGGKAKDWKAYKEWIETKGLRKHRLSKGKFMSKPAPTTKYYSKLTSEMRLRFGTKPPFRVLKNNEHYYVHWHSNVDYLLKRWSKTTPKFTRRSKTLLVKYSHFN